MRAARLVFVSLTPPQYARGKAAGGATADRRHRWRTQARAGADRVGPVFKPKRSEAPDESVTDDAAAHAAAAEASRSGKGRPTPTRREAEAARRRPLVPADRKEAKRKSREKLREDRYRHRLAMEAGEEWALPPKDRGPQRKFIRDYIDARWSFAEFLLPVMVVGLPISLIGNRTALLVGYAVVYGALLMAILDTTILWQQVKRKVRAKFGEDPQRGSLWYVITRAMQIRPGRLPKPKVARGQYPS